MASPPLTRTTVDVLTLLLDAWEHKADLDGWQLMKTLRRSGPAIYRVLDRLESAGWITGEWERIDPAKAKRPRRRFYRLTGVGADKARAQAAGKPKPSRGLRALRPQWSVDFLGSRP
jgi:DNA-binding PadR family transcriptional regulator